MLFNSYEFGIFLVAVFFLYWFIFNKKLWLQNLFIVAVSYLFYGWWDWRFLSLIAGSSLLDYFLALKISESSKKQTRRRLLLVSLAVNLGVLGVFKYFNFFAGNFQSLFAQFGIKLDALTINVILPVGISFYTFQTLSYTIDVYNKKLKPTKDLISFTAFVSFFPQLVAGPIERAVNLLPQFYYKRKFEYDKAVDGLKQILWGLVKKVVIADNAAIYVNDVFQHYDTYQGSTLAIGTVLFAFQIYGDFSGYSDIAIGTARLFGFDLKKNFAFPYFSRDIAEFWRRWHISLSTWFRDYLYIPLGGSKGSKTKVIRNVFIIFIVSGFWHGAAWTYITWGALNALYFIPYLLIGKNRKNTENIQTKYILPSFKTVISIGLTFGLVCVAWVFFRAESMSIAYTYLKEMFSTSLFSRPDVIPYQVSLFIFIFSIFEWVQRHKNHGLEFQSNRKTRFFRWLLYYGLIYLVVFYSGNNQSFIYFQF